MPERPRRQFLIFCGILALVAALVALGGWCVRRDVEGNVRAPSPPGDRPAEPLPREPRRTH